MYPEKTLQTELLGKQMSSSGSWWGWEMSYA